MTTASRDLLLRVTAFIIVFAILVLYLYGIQLAYEVPKQHPLAKAALFSGVVMGSGLCWDVTKHVAKLKSNQLRRFLTTLGKTFLFTTLYVVLLTIAYLLLGPWAGPQTIASPIIAILSIFFCVKANLAFGEAIDAALKEESGNNGPG